MHDPAVGKLRSPPSPKRATITAALRLRKAAPSRMEATTRPPGELMATTSRTPRVLAADSRNERKVSGVSSSITPSATITCGHLAPQLRPSSLARRKLIGSPCATALSALASIVALINASADKTSIAVDRFFAMHPLFQVVGGDGLEPPTLSV